MPKNIKSTQDATKVKTDQYKKNKPNWVRRVAASPILWIIVATIILTAALYIAFYHALLTPDQDGGVIIDDRAKTFVGSVLILWTLAVIAIQAYIYFRQAELMREGLDKTQSLIDQTERHFQETERPIIVVEDARIPQFPTDEKPLRPRIILANRGRQGAKWIRIRFEIAEPGDHAVQPPYRTDSILEIDFMGAGSSLELTPPRTDGYPIPLETQNMVRQEGKALLIFGEGSYTNMNRHRQYRIIPFIFCFDDETGQFVRDYKRPKLWEQNEQAAQQSQKQNN